MFTVDKLQRKHDIPNVEKNELFKNAKNIIIKL